MFPLVTWSPPPKDKACLIFASTLPPKTRSRNQLCQAQPIWYKNTASIVITFPAKLFSCGDKAQSPQLSVQISTVCAINVFCVESYLLDTGH